MTSKHRSAEVVAGAVQAVPESAAAKCPIPWWKRLTLLTFMFFLIKGLAWLIVPALIVWWRAIAE